jgi:hypothetical protein
MKKRIRVIIFCLVGFALLFFALFIDQYSHISYEISINISLVAFSVSLLDFLWFIAGGKPEEMQINQLSIQIERLSKSVSVIENAKKVGIKSLYDCIGNYGGKDQWFDLMRSCNKKMDLMGRTLYEWIRAPDFDEIIKEKISNSNVNFRWLIMSSNNACIEQLEEDGKKIGEMLSKKLDPVCSRLKKIKDSLEESKKNNLQLRVFTKIPLYCSIIRIDDTFFVNQYLQSTSSRNSPLLVIENANTPWAITYDREFDFIWNSAIVPDCFK